MALQDILNKIQKETDDKVQKLDEEHAEKIKKLESEFSKKKKAAEDDMSKRVDTSIKKIHEKTEMLAKMEAKNELLKNKRDLIESVFVEAIEKLKESEDYQDILVSLLNQTDISDSDVEVVPAKGKEKETEQAIKKSGKKYKLAGKSTNILGGFILQTKTIEIDNSFESIIGRELRSDLELEIAKVLF